MTSHRRARVAYCLLTRGCDPVSVVLDTAVLIAAERGTFDMPGYLASTGAASVALAAISASEFASFVKS